MASYNESIVAYFGGDTKGLQQAIGSANILVKGFSETASKALGAIGKGFGAAFAAGALVKGFIGAANAAQELRDKAYESGQAVDSATMALARTGDEMDSVSRVVVDGWGAIAEGVQGAVLQVTAWTMGIDVAADAYRRLQKDVDPAKLAAAQKKLADAQRDTAMAGLNEQQKMNALLQENIALREAVKNPELNELQRIGAMLELEKNIKAVRESDANLRREAAQQEAKADADRQRTLERSLDLAEKQAEFERESLPIQEQVNALKQEEARLAAEVLDPETSVTDLIGKQNRLLEIQKELRDKNMIVAEETARQQQIQLELTAKNNKLYGDFMAQLVGVSDKRDFTEGTTASLEELVRRNKAELIGKRAGTAFDFGDNYDISRLQNEISRAERELEFRRNFQQDLALGGVGLARRNFQGDPLEFDRVLQQMTTGLSANQETSDTLKRIEDFLTGG